MSTVPATNVGLKETKQTIYGDKVFTSDIRMDTLYGTTLTTPATGPISLGDFRNKVGQSSIVNTFNGPYNTNTTFYQAFGGVNLGGLYDANVFAGYMWVTIGYSGLYRSTNGTDWTQVISGAYGRISVGNGVMIVGAQSNLSPTCYITTDGINFTAAGVTGDAVNDPYSISKIGSTIVLTSGKYLSPSIWYSTNGGSNWTSISTMPGGLTTQSIGFLVGYWPSQNKLYLVGETTNRKYSSSDGINWTNLGSGTGSAQSLSGNQGFGNSLEVKDSFGQPALAFANRNHSLMITSDGINYGFLGAASGQTGIGNPGWLGRINNWYVVAPYRIGGNSVANWSATGQSGAWINASIGAINDRYFVGYNNRLYSFRMYLPNSSSAVMQWGYYDYSTVAPT